MSYTVETLDPDDDDGTMPDNVETLRDAVVGHRIVSAERLRETNQSGNPTESFVITLDTGKRVRMRDSSDCCAYTELESFLLHTDQVDHIITGVGTTDGYNTWHIFADMGDVLALNVGWSAGNPFWYGYGFDIKVEEVK